MRFNLFRYYDGMAAGLKSKVSPSSPYLNYILTSLKAVILLSFVLAVGFLMIILSCALWSNWLPLLVGGSTFLPSPTTFPGLLLLLPADTDVSGQH